MAGLGIEEFAGGGEGFCGRILIFPTRRDVLATVDAFGFVRTSRDSDGDADFDFGMHGDGDLVLADGLDRRVQHDLAAANDDAIALERCDDVANAHRSEQLTGLRRLTQYDDVAAVDLLRDLCCLALGLQVAGFELGLHAIELGTVVRGGAQRLAALEQKIAGKPVLDADDFAHMTELGDALQQDDFHIRSPFEVIRI
ncbi:hypothetical protein GALL_431150 [mine drainage metagenome]|uniref:Uncharacterized protein n=1 Tax=mine drainage metagenome TaxID=410659 RepID=A0A1J5PUD1_9ZZZZ